MSEEKGKEKELAEETQDIDEEGSRAGGDCENKGAGVSVRDKVATESPKRSGGRLNDYIAQMTPKRELMLHTLRPEGRPTEEERLMSAIDEALRGVDEMRRQARAHDEEIARLGEETRRLIAEMQHDLNLKAA
jgi:hypothetical protein